MSMDFFCGHLTKKLSSIYFETYLRTDESGEHKTLDIFRTNKNKHSKTSRINLTCSSVKGRLLEIHSVEISCSRSAIGFTITNKSFFFTLEILKFIFNLFSLFFALYNASRSIRVGMNVIKVRNALKVKKHLNFTHLKYQCVNLI